MLASPAYHQHLSVEFMDQLKFKPLFESSDDIARNDVTKTTFNRQLQGVKLERKLVQVLYGSSSQVEAVCQLEQKVRAEKVKPCVGVEEECVENHFVEEVASVPCVLE